MADRDALPVLARPGIAAEKLLLAAAPDENAETWPDKARTLAAKVIARIMLL